MSNIIDLKRDSLEAFIREQMIGPNGCRGKFSYHPDAEDSVCKEEVVNTTPGSIYSTAILFPKQMPVEDRQDSGENRQTSVESSDESSDADEVATSETAPAEAPQQETNFELYRQEEIDDEDIYSLSRRFPHAIGMSCCLAKEALINGNLRISISGRYYKKITGTDRRNIRVNLTDNDKLFKDFWNTTRTVHQYFSFDGKYLSIKDINSKNVSNVKQLLRDLNQELALRIAKRLNIVEKVKAQYRFLLSYREYLFNQLRQVKDGQYLSDEDINKFREGILEIENYETIISYFDDLLSMYDKKSFGFWRSISFTKDIDLSSIPLDKLQGHKTIFKPEDYPALKNIILDTVPNRNGEGGNSSDRHISLSAWLQITKDSRSDNDDKVYLKLLIQNDSTPFQEDKHNYFSIVNEQVNLFCFFGIKGSVISEYLLPYRKNENYEDVSKAEDKLNYLYREIEDYGVGHMCSVDWNKDSKGKVNEVYIEFLPSFETPDVEPVPRKKFSEYVATDGVMVPAPFLEDTNVLQFKRLSSFSEVSDKEIINELKKFVNAYGLWIQEMRERLVAGDLEFGNANLDECESDYMRMLSNINDILLSNSTALKAFRVMNSAMYMQLWHNKLENQEQIRELGRRKLNADFYKSSSDEIFKEGEHAAWRPFQLAFILLNLDGIFNNPKDPQWNKRNELVDLVWFPTGGGKTEAYLGLIALCILNRRISYGAKGGGVSAIMRYTLRLLTTQQFQRALRLIMALEQIRRWDPKHYGEDAISIGLYVGDASLPNTKRGLNEEAIKWSGKETSNNTKIPMDLCPWCGKRLTYDPGVQQFFCENRNCTFGRKAVPVELCDESIYENPPSLLFGTVDKFAAIAHKVSTSNNEKAKDSRRIFGTAAGFLTPDLIIQDELHLLLGPLGSAVSFFEGAIDQLCSRDVTLENGNKITLRPKIISSTATTRNTELQIRALYDRSVNIFPKNGLTHDDSFFSFYKREKVDDKERYCSKRKYIGIMPTGRTQMTTQMRLAAIIFVHRAIFELEYGNEADFEKAADNYYSVLSYFNSLREVGKTDALFYTEYAKYTKRLFKRVLRYGNLMDCFYSGDNLGKAELTSRLSGEEINGKFAEVEQRWEMAHRLPYKDEDGNWNKAVVPPDYILATNMISVGLDVSRFNTIIMNSMPRNIAEYIQASSRVARSVKGLVLTLHNPFRSRDVSHFERFREFHEKLYYYVEPISITPFSKKSVQKYLPLYMASIIRHLMPELANNNAAAQINKDKLKEKAMEIVSRYFIERHERSQRLPNKLEKQLLTTIQLKDIEQLISSALDQWSNMATEHPSNLVYENKGVRRNDKTPLFTSPNDYEETKNASNWTVSSSLRMIEPEAVLNVRVLYKED